MGMCCASSPGRLPGKQRRWRLGSRPWRCAKAPRGLLACTWSTRGWPIQSTGRRPCGRSRPRTERCTGRGRSGGGPDSRARPPGPELRADEIDVAYSLALEGARQVQMKAGKVGEDGQGGTGGGAFRRAGGARPRRAGILCTTSSRPTSATSAESTTVSTPAARICGPPMPNRCTSARARRAVARRAAYMSPEASPAEISTFDGRHSARLAVRWI